MNRHALLAALLLPALSASPAGQDPAPAAQASASIVPLGQRLKAERPEVDRLLEALQPKEALVKAEALLPATKPLWDNTDPNTQYRSYFVYQDLASVYYLASRAATSAGEWEKGLDYVRKAQSAMQENATLASAAFTKISEAHAAHAERIRTSLKENDALIKGLQSKPVKDAADEQQLGFIEKDRQALQESEKWAKQYLLYADTARKEGARYDPSVRSMEERLKFETTQIADYKPGNGEKVKWVDAIVSNPSYLTTNFPEKQARFEFLCRLAVLDPANPKVGTAMDVELGKVPPPTVSPAKGKNGKNGKKGK